MEVPKEEPIAREELNRAIHADIRARARAKIAQDEVRAFALDLGVAIFERVVLGDAQIDHAPADEERLVQGVEAADEAARQQAYQVRVISLRGRAKQRG